jgi:hypothetical protein
MSDGNLELYKAFTEFVGRDIQSERKLANRRMFGVFLWCFMVPAFFTFSFVLGLKLGYIPLRYGRYADWIIVVFPVAYSVYILSFDLIRELPTAYRRGGVAANLARGYEDARWRTRVCTELKPMYVQKQWPWLIKTFYIDLMNLQHRTRYLTALAGAVFFLLMKGLDFFDLAEPMPHPSGYILGWFESSSSNAAQFTGLALFLVMLYLSGNQVYHSLARYLSCLELVEVEMDHREDLKR